MSGRSFAIMNMCLSIAACIGYLYAKDYRRALYWAAAAVLTASVTF